jgi:predicted ATPase
MMFRDFSIIYHINRVFVANTKSEKIPLKGDSILSSSASNLEKVLKRILLDEIKREEIKEWLDLFIPGFENIEIVSSELSGTDTLVMSEKGIKKPFTKDLLSDGTYNILALLTAVYQSDEPQFLCIEEPENGLHPKVIKELVHLFRDACKEKGHYIWLNTHSQTLVAELQPEEIILVNKKKGETITKQLKNHNMHGLRMDEAWLTAALGGGLPW